MGCIFPLPDCSSLSFKVLYAEVFSHYIYSSRQCQLLLGKQSSSVSLTKMSNSSHNSCLVSEEGVKLSCPWIFGQIQALSVIAHPCGTSCDLPEDSEKRLALFKR